MSRGAVENDKDADEDKGSTLKNSSYSLQIRIKFYTVHAEVPGLNKDKRDEKKRK